MALQSVVGSPRSRQMDSRANLTTFGGFGRFLISTRCGLLILFTATLTVRILIHTVCNRGIVHMYSTLQQAAVVNKCIAQGTQMRYTGT